MASKLLCTEASNQTTNDRFAYNFLKHFQSCVFLHTDTNYETCDFVIR